MSKFSRTGPSQCQLQWDRPGRLLGCITFLSMHWLNWSHINVQTHTHTHTKMNNAHSHNMMLSSITLHYMTSGLKAASDLTRYKSTSSSQLQQASILGKRGKSGASWIQQRALEWQSCLRRLVNKYWGVVCAACRIVLRERERERERE